MGQIFSCWPYATSQRPEALDNSLRIRKLSRESLYRTLSRKGNPRFSTLEAVLESVGLKLAVEVKPLA